MKVFCLTAGETANKFIAKIFLAIVVFTSLSLIEANAQKIYVSNSTTSNAMRIGRSDATYPCQISFGQGNLSSGNEGLWYIGHNTYGFSMGRVWNAVDLYGTLPASTVYAVYISSSNGSVGIHKSNPSNSYKLDVDGLIRSSNGVCNSDRRYKRDIQPINNLDNLFKVNSVQYKASDQALKEQLELFKQENKYMPEQDFNSRISDFESKIAERNADTRTYFGFIAQELKEVYPDLVYEDDQGYLAVNYVGLIPVLVDAIKELKAEINEMKGKNRESAPSNISSAVLYQNNPNPFSERTEIKFYVPENASNAFICIYDMVGSQLMKLNVTKGYASLFVNGSELKPGMYLYSLIVDGKEIDTKRMILTDN
ncbi:MAG: tail fiber domain-containing protein [Bacteroidetes bacterium]|nr:tail fiber domain-containing protein [Bacteroidota bacterium]